MIAPDIRQLAFANNRNAYVTAFGGAHEEFDWVVTDVVLDDPSLAFVSVVLSAELADVPSVLTNTNGWSLISTPVEGSGDAMVAVRLGSDGAVEGIWAGGG